MPHDKLWQCFLTNADSNKPEPKSVSRLDNLGMDSAKLQCCFRAATMTCQRLCIKTYSNEWEETWGDFDRQCQYQLAESPMLRCLAE
ncbi:reversion-inducing cysteine-rich protein with Kazal motifs, partial [Trichonephila inaurata madagascariensis]